MSSTLVPILVFAGTFNYLALTDCEGSCFETRDAPAFVSLSAGRVVHLTDNIGSEVYFRYGLPMKLGNVQPVLGVSQTDSQDTWYGAGVQYLGDFDGEAGGTFFSMSFMPGAYERGDGPDLGMTLEFRSSLEIGYEFDNGMRVALSGDHRSNADLADTNPGMETFQLRFDVPLGR
ncbi:MAG: acyloxyacyl hydrolase [Paracoccaceae bacterium]|jgi:hypothetical protein